ncbi:MAG: phosphohistidine phosphatase SixA [Pseudomonadota bacterium]|nr:phosphohistidine phosphatase SixA [Pseudomonadota bacterium]
MAIFLVQHGKNTPKDQDPEQPLSEEGHFEVKRIANVAKEYHIPVKCIKHSGKKRAQQTAELFAAECTPDPSVEMMAGLGALDEVTVIAAQLKPSDNVMLVGHLPFMEKLVCYLTTASTEHRVVKFQNGGIVCLDKNIDDKQWFIKWTLMPHIQ